MIMFYTFKEISHTMFGPFQKLIVTNNSICSIFIFDPYQNEKTKISIFLH